MKCRGDGTVAARSYVGWIQITPLALGGQGKCRVHPPIRPAECAAEDLALPESGRKIPQQSHLKYPQIRIEGGYLCILKVEPDSGQGIEALEKRFFRRATDAGGTAPSGSFSGASQVRLGSSPQAILGAAVKMKTPRTPYSRNRSNGLTRRG